MATNQQKIEQLRKLIGETHQHGIKLEGEIKTLRAHKPRGWVVKVAGKRSLLAGLKALNSKRRVELARLEHKKPPAPPPKPKPPPPPPQRFTMFDSVTPSAIPTNAAAAACYVNGSFANCTAIKLRTPHAKHLTISVNASTDADCLDVETGDATPAQAPGWVRKQHARGVKRPVVYANTSTMPQVIEVLTNNGIKRSEYLVWTAHYTGVAHIEPGSDATQYEEDRARDLDLSLCEPWFLP